MPSLSDTVTFTKSEHGIQANVVYRDSTNNVAQIFAGGATRQDAAESLVKWLITLGMVETPKSCENCGRAKDEPDHELAPCGLPCTEFDLWIPEPEPEPEPPSRPSLRVIK